MTSRAQNLWWYIFSCKYMMKNYLHKKHTIRSAVRTFILSVWGSYVKLLAAFNRKSCGRLIFLFREKNSVNLICIGN